MQDRNACPLDELLAEADLMQGANSFEHVQCSEPAIGRPQVCYRLVSEMLFVNVSKYAAQK